MSKKLELPICPVEVTLFFIDHKWKVLIVRELLTGTKRFGALRNSLTGITQKTLTQNLRAMESHGIVSRKVYPEVPPRVEYSLTELGASLRPVLDAMYNWGESLQAHSNHSKNTLQKQ